MPTGLGDEQLWLSATNDNTGTSTAFNDQSGQGNDGTVSGGMLVVADTNEGGSYAYDNNSTNQFVEVSGTIGTTFVSTAMWIKRAALDNVTTWFCGTNAYSSPAWSDSLYSYDGSDYARAGDAQTAISPALPSSGVWFHLCMVSNGGTTDIYVDGLLHDSVSTASPTATTEEFRLGASIGSTVTSSKYYDDIRVYNRVLTQSEIAHLATSRGIEGPAPVGLGTEEQWLCPTLNNTNPLSDLSGNANNASQIGTIATTSDTGEGGLFAYDYTGTVGIDSGLPSGLASSPVMSFSMWIKADSVASRQRLLSNNKANDNFMLTLESGGLISVSYYDGTTLYGKSSTSISASQWYHIYCSYSSGSAGLYIDGVEQTGTTALSGGNGSSSIYYGYNTNSQILSGLADDIRKHDRVLTQSEITHLASSRGVEGPAPVGLGTEKTWLCPSLLDAPTDITGLKTYTYNGGLATVANTEEGGTRAYDFDKTTAKAVLQDSLEVMDDTDSFSVTGWIKPSELTNSNNYFFADCRSKTGSSYNGWALYLRPSGGQLYLGSGIFRGSRVGSNTGLLIDSVTTNRLNVWTHLAVNWDNTTLTWELFVDGVSTDTFAPSALGGSVVSAGTHLAVANYSPAPDAVYPMVGLMDDFRVHDRALTPAETTHLASSRGIEGPAPIGLGDEQMWFCPSIYSSGNDITGSAADETLVGSMAIVSETQSGGTLAYDIPSGSNGGLTFTPPASTIASGQAASITVAMWADHTDFTTNYLFSLGNNTFNDYLLVTGASNDFIKGQVNGGINSGNVQFTRGNPMQHYVFEFTPTAIKIFINGVLAVTTTGTWSGDTWDRGAIGALSRQALTQGAQCTLDDIRVYGRTLTEAEITHLATSRGIEGGPDTPPTTGFYNPFINKIFNNDYTRRIR